MSLATTSPIGGPYTGDATTVDFSFPYKYVSASDLLVYVTDTTTGVVTLQTSGYSVSASGSAVNGVYPAATITFTAAPSATQVVKIVRAPSLTQSFDFDSESDPLPVLTRYADYVTMQLQYLQAQISNGPAGNIGSGVFSGALPSIDAADGGDHLALSSDKSELIWAATENGTTISSQWAYVLGLTAPDFSSMTSAAKFGADAIAVDAFAPGSGIFNITSTSTATSGQDYASQIVYTLAPGSNSTGDHRAGYVRVQATGAHDIQKIDVWSAYCWNDSTGNITSAFGGSFQYLGKSTGTATAVDGVAGLVRQQVSNAGLITNGRGVVGAALNESATTTCFTTAIGVQGYVQQDAAGLITTAYGTQGEIIANAGSITTVYGLYSLTQIASGATIGTYYGLRIDLSNAGTLTNRYALYIGSITGSAPGTANYAIYSVSTADSYFAGAIGIFYKPASGLAALAIEQGSTLTSALHLLKTDDGANGPLITTQHVSASPAASDQLFNLTVKGYDSGGNSTTYCQMRAVVSDPTDASEDSYWQWSTFVAGTFAQRFRLGGGLYPATGGTDPGDGKISANAFYAGAALAIDAVGGTVNQTASAANIGAAANAVNTANKVAGKQILDTTNHKLYVARGSNATDPWDLADGSASITPS